MDQVAQRAFDEGLIADPSPDALIKAVQDTIGARTTYKMEVRRQEKNLRDQERRTVEFDKAQTASVKDGGKAVDFQQMSPGDKLAIDGEDVEVMRVETDEAGFSTTVTLKDGKRFGVLSFDATAQTGVIADGLKAEPRTGCVDSKMPQNGTADVSAGSPDFVGDPTAETRVAAGAPGVSPINSTSVIRGSERAASDKTETQAIGAGSSPATGAFQSEGGPGAAAATEYKASEALKSIDPTRFQTADRLIYRRSPEAELDQIAAQMLDEGNLETFTDQLLTQSPEEIGFTGREYVALAGQAMFRWEQKAMAAEKTGKAAEQRTAESRAARLFELVQDGLNRGASVTQVGAYLMRSDPLFMLRRQVAKIEQAQIDDAKAATGIDPQSLEDEIKRRVQEELDRLAELRDIEAEDQARKGRAMTPEGQAKILIRQISQQFTDTSSGRDGPPKIANQVKALVKRAMKGEDVGLENALRGLGISEPNVVRLTGLAEEGARRVKTAARDKAAAKVVKSLEPKAPRKARSKLPPMIKKMMDAIDSGMVLTNPEFLKAYREAFDIPDTLTPERMAKMRALANTIREGRKGSAEVAEAMAAMQDELALAKGLKVADLIRAGWYGSLLSGIGTQAVNIAQNAANGGRIGL
ncbi:hypothetical protein, partial [Prosthecobacter sp.]|uniref:hypothetical protein n=1 Tax=Prosthecobacter sp. TaxID=1965333 RepID=UPI0037851145